MFVKLKKSKPFKGISPWIIIGSIAVLFPIFAMMTLSDINRQKENSIQLLFEKGAALVRSFEAGTRMGMMGMPGKGFKLQVLLTETAKQPDIAYLIVTRADGVVVAHSKPDKTGSIYGNDINRQEVLKQKRLFWQKITGKEKAPVFEVFGKFSPIRGPFGHHRGMMKGLGHWIEKAEPGHKPPNLLIFVGLDMNRVELSRSADTRHTVMMALFMLILGVCGVMLLILAQNYRSARASLSRVKALSDKIIKNMPIGLVALDKDRRIAALNAVADQVLQIDPTKAMGSLADEILPEPMVSMVAAVDGGREVDERQIVCSFPGSPKVPLETSVAKLYNDEGHFLGHVILFKDLTEIDALRKNLEKNKRLASIGRLAAGVAHEIRNPLSSIKGFATYFKEKKESGEKDRQMSSVMIQEVDRLNRVVSQLLDFSGPVRLLKQEVALDPFIQDSLEVVFHQAESSDITISTELAAQDAKAFIDIDKISQVLLNLYLNAIQAMKSGGTLLIKTSVAENGDLSIHISDTGKGIKKRDLPNIFEPYFSTKPMGTGLGLAIVHNIVAAHEGEIRAKSVEGKGTAITLILPNKRSIQ